jgi:hypothetical protein
MSAARLWGGCAIALVLFGGCAPSLMVPLQTELEAPRPSWESHQGMRVTGFVTNDGMYHRYDGWVKLQGDSLAFHGNPSHNEHGQADSLVATAQVTTLFTRETTDLKVTRAMVIVLITLGLLGLLVATAAGVGTGS